MLRIKILSLLFLITITVNAQKTRFLKVDPATFQFGQGDEWKMLKESYAQSAFGDYVVIRSSTPLTTNFDRKIAKDNFNDFIEKAYAVGVPRDACYLRHSPQPEIWLQRRLIPHKEADRAAPSGAEACSHEFDSDKGIIIDSQSGMSYKFPKNALQRNDGTLYQGKVCVVIEEYLNQRDLLFGDLTTTASGRVLESAGSFYIMAFDEQGSKLELLPKRPVKIIYPEEREVPEDMYTFYGSPMNGIINWQLDPSLPVVPERQAREMIMEERTVTVTERVQFYSEDEYSRQVWVDDGENVQEYKEELRDPMNTLTSEKLGWINCDRFAEDDVVVTHLARIKGEIKAGAKFKARLIFKEMNSVMKADEFDPVSNEYAFKGIGANQPVMLVVYYWDAGKVVAGIANSNSNEKSTIQLKEMSNEEFESQLGEYLN